MKRFQGTLARPVEFVGVGLHSGSLVTLEILPSEANTGILFQRTDMDALPVQACPANISSTILCTTIGKHPNNIATIEHLMAAFWGVGIDNAVVRVNAAEIPILDGSSAPFVDKFSEAGLQIQHVPRPLIKFKKPFEILDEDKFVKYEPHEDTEKQILEITCTVDFPSSVIGKQSLDFQFTADSFLKISEARTFCHLDSVKIMHSKGLAQGGSLDNAVVVDNDRVLNTDGLRFSDEFVRHKVLDFIGDVALLPGNLVGKVKLCKNGHSLHARFTKKIMSLLESKNNNDSLDYSEIAMG